MNYDLEQIAHEFSLQFAQSLDKYRFVKESIKRIPYLFAKQKTVLPLYETSEKMYVALDDPLHLTALHELQFMVNKPCEPIISPKEEILRAINRCYQVDAHKPSPVESKMEEYDVLDNTSDNPIIASLNQIIVEALQQKASDIHIQKEETALVVKFRVDGVLQKKFSFSSTIHRQLIARIKVLAKLDIAEQRLPQDGRVKLRMSDREIDFRVSTIPTVYGERAVLRILDKGNIDLGLSHIGMHEEMLEKMRKWIEFPEGIILVTGPTGSGKTTTLYSAILELNPDEKNIMTIEDPIEYKIPHIAQIPVNPKIQLTFAMGLRHILRQDPDVILIGEIRDKETAEIAIKASLTGHLVLSTLHTNDAPSAITRLADMGVEKYLLASSLIGVVAQRLVRKICPNCRISYFPSKEELEELGVQFKVAVRFFEGKGCKKCFNTGYSGRLAIYEMMPIEANVKRQILQHVDSESLRRASKIIGLRNDGMELVKKGLTTSKEVLRVTRINEV